MLPLSSSTNTDVHTNPTHTDKPNTPSRMRLAKVIKKLTVCHAGAVTTQPKPIPVKSATGEATTQQPEVHAGVLMLWPCSRLQPATINPTIPASSTYRVTPDDHTSTLNPGKVSRPLAISGGWNAGDPWLVRQMSSTANVSRAWWKHQNMWSYYCVTVQEIQGLMKKSKHAKLLLYISQYNKKLYLYNENQQHSIIVT